MRLASARFERLILLNRPRNLARPLATIMRNLLIFILIFIVSCDNSARYEEESLSFLENVYSDFDISDCKFVIHPFGLIMNPLLDKNEIEEELSEFLGSDVWSRIKIQRDLSKKFETDIKISKNHISSNELTLFVKEAKDSKLNFWDEINSRYGCISGISIPVFSDDYSYAFIYVYTMCHGNAGGGRCVLYHFEDSRWILKKEFNQWIS